MASIENLNDLFIEELRDLYSAETQLTEALPEMAQASKSPKLRQGFEAHLRETKEHVHRLQKIFDALGLPPEGKTCKAMKGLIAEAKEVIDEDADPEVLDAALIVAAQKVEHYEISGYGSMRTFARILQYRDAEKLLETTLKEEAATDEKLTKLAESTINPRADTADEAKTE
jgi:ferritin-like metal-binding protein YciE